MTATAHTIRPVGSGPGLFSRTLVLVLLADFAGLTSFYLLLPVVPQYATAASMGTAGAMMPGHLLEALGRGYDVLGFGAATGRDEVFKGLVLARIIEPDQRLSRSAPLQKPAPRKDALVVRGGTAPCWQVGSLSRLLGRAFGHGLRQGTRCSCDLLTMTRASGETASGSRSASVSTMSQQRMARPSRPPKATRYATYSPRSTMPDLHHQEDTDQARRPA